MLIMLYAIVTVLAWGIWLAPSQNIYFKNQLIRTFYVAVANLILATLIFFLQVHIKLTWGMFWMPFVGGLVWAVNGFMAFNAADLLGMAHAYGLWAPINFGISVMWRTIIFDEFIALRLLKLLMLAFSFMIIFVWILLLIFVKGSESKVGSRCSSWIGVLGCVVAGRGFNISQLGIVVRG